MFITLVYLAVLLGLLSLYYGYAKDQFKFGHIPGPRKLPFIGNALQLQHRDEDGKVIPLQQQLTIVGKKYGDIMWINLGFLNLVVVNGYKMMHEALVKKGTDFADRSTAFRSEAIRISEGLFPMKHGPRQKIVKNILHQSLRVYGEGKDNLEKVVYQSLGDLVEKLNAKESQPVDVTEIFMEAFANTIHILVFGKQLDPAGETFLEFMNLLNDLIAAFSTDLQGMLLDNYPMFRHVFRGRMKKVLKYGFMRDEFWTKHVEEHKANWNGKEENCLLDVLLNEQRKRAEIESEEQLSDDQIRLILDNIHVAGFLTSSGVMTGLILVCLHQPEIQAKIYSEVCSVVGATGQVSINHKHQLHYTRAVLFEALRYISLGSLGAGLPRETTRDTTLGGYHIPKGTSVVMNQWAVHHDPDLWTDPWSFQPERYLDPEGVLVGPDHPNRKRLLPFGAGERVCVAEVFALNRLCLFLTTLVQRFHFTPEDPTSLPTADPREWAFGFLVNPPFYKARFIPRE